MSCQEKARPGDTCAQRTESATGNRFGALKRGSSALVQRVNTILTVLPVVRLDSRADQSYAEIRCHLEQAGKLVGPNDLLIAAQAKGLGLTVVTGNQREFQRIPGLAVDNWL